ncbi:MAG: DUF3572 family protein [Devosia sp.]
MAGLCLQHLADNPDQLAEFMSISGLSPDSLRREIATPSFGRGLIDYFVGNEPLLLALCAQTSLSPDSVMRVWAKLNPAG